MVKIGLVVLEDINGRWTTHDDTCQPIAIGHLRLSKTTLVAKEYLLKPQVFPKIGPWTLSVF